MSMVEDVIIGILIVPAIVGFLEIYVNFLKPFIKKLKEKNIV